MDKSLANLLQSSQYHVDNLIFHEGLKQIILS